MRRVDRSLASHLPNLCPDVQNFLENLTKEVIHGISETEVKLNIEVNKEVIHGIPETEVKLNNEVNKKVKLSIR